MMTDIDQQIMVRLNGLDDAQKHQVLEFINTLQQGASHYTARDLLGLAPDERESLVRAAFDAAAAEDFEIFEADREEDLDAGES